MRKCTIFMLIFFINSNPIYAVFEFEEEYNSLDNSQKYNAFVNLHNKALIIIEKNKDIHETSEAEMLLDMKNKQLKSPLNHPNIFSIQSFEDPMKFLQLSVVILKKVGQTVVRLNPFELKQI